jgi:hypothetical protein
MAENVPPPIKHSESQVAIINLMEMPSDIDRMTLGLTRGSHCRTQTAGFIRKQADIQPRVSEPEIIS